MDDRGKDSRGASLIGQLLLQLAQREGFRRKLAELEEQGGDTFVENLLAEFEKLVERLYSQQAGASKIPAPPPEPGLTAPPPPPAVDPTPFSAVFSPAIKDDYKIELPKLSLRVSSNAEKQSPKKGPGPEPRAQKGSPPSAGAKDLPPPVAPAPAQPAPPAPAKVTPPAVPRPSAPPAAPPVKPPAPRAASPEPAPTPAVPPVPPPAPITPAPPPDEGATFEKPLTPPKQVHPRTVQTIEDDDILYFHAVAQIPLDEKPSHQPFMMEEKGIVDKECTIAFDRGGIRFYVSRILPGSMNVSKTGMLLLNKQDSLRMRGVHYSILNDLRAHGVLLPFAFGTLVVGKENLVSIIDDRLYDLRDALEEMLSTRWWNLAVLALDSKMAQSLAGDLSGGMKERERRMQGTRLPVAGRLDIKTLERVLGKQKKIAGSIHDELKEHAVRSDVDLMVGLNSGSSDDWKPILRASYEVPLSAVHDFNRAVIDLQYRHFQHDLMFVLNGDREEFTFGES